MIFNYFWLQTAILSTAYKYRICRIWTAICIVCYTIIVFINQFQQYLILLLISRRSLEYKWLHCVFSLIDYYLSHIKYMIHSLAIAGRAWLTVTTNKIDCVIKYCFHKLSSDHFSELGSWATCKAVLCINFTDHSQEFRHTYQKK